MYLYIYVKIESHLIFMVDFYLFIYFMCSLIYF